MIARLLSRLLSIATSLVIYFCVSTLIAEVVLSMYLWSTWDMNRDKMIQMLAIAQGIDLFGAGAEEEKKPRDARAEQATLEKIIQVRAAKDRNLKMREMALKNGMDQLKFEQRRLAQEQQQYQQLVASFNTRMLELVEGAKAAGREEVGRTLETIKPKQAKEFILEMLDKKEITEVVILLSNMAERPRGKIIAEFKTPQESEKIAEVLRLIRQGEPEASAAQEALGQLSPE